MRAVTSVVGATGLLGGAICEHLVAAGRPVRALVRPTSEPERLTRLTRLGVEPRQGDLKEPASLAAVCEGARAVISTATCMLSRQPGDSIQAVDVDGQLALLEAARRAGVEHFIFISFIPLQERFPLQEAKRTVEQALRRSGMPHYTILRPSYFTEVWLGPALGFDAANARARLFGTGHGRMNWISLDDVARFAVGALERPQARDAILDLGGEEALSQCEVVRLFQQWDGREWALDSIPEQVLHAEFEEATDARHRSVTALMLNIARGREVDPRPAMEAIPVRPTPVSDYVRGVLARLRGSAPEAPML
ncbi:SDR family oxidoreductase [Pyxidicoccus trucidator]|uniref:SDR family oxidoreductase n=1 Tax=Pyxidicoccus trucidator TaxID=2709662 RepID=UPI001966F89F|nr:SDR family oxidoreductase [Pyxidicoccus trucidator]